MGTKAKSAQLQIRVSEAQKLAIQEAARMAGMDMSSYVLARALPSSRARFLDSVDALGLAVEPSFVLAELNALLTALGPDEYADAVAQEPRVQLTPFAGNYLAAMVEYGCARVALAPPAWTRRIPALAEPYFGTSLVSLRLHLLLHSPAPFRCRNLFVDATLGSQV